jgi:hypothetical protein
MTLKKSETADVNGTSLQGYVYQTYARLVEVFGEPSHDGDGYKTDAEWTLTDEKGNVVTIYNWKDGPNYCGRDGTPVEEIYEWHVGGKDENVVELVQATMPHAKVRKGWR